jgi:DNA-binding transcriptional LysR family regulator
MDKLSAMTTFVRIVDAGSLTAAANALGTSLPTVVRTLAGLERELGISLLKRTTRRINLTDEGAQYLERCRVILTAVLDAEEALGTRRSEPAGKLTVTASSLFGRRHVAPIVCDFVSKYPKVTAEMLFVDRIVNLVEENIDVGVRIAQLKDSSMVAIPVGHTRRVVCASPAYLRRHGAPQSLQVLSEHVFVRHTGLTPHNETQFRVGHRTVSVPITSAVTCNDIDSAVNACVDGLGLGMFLSYMVAPNCKRGELRYVLESFETEPRPVQVVYPQSKLLPNKSRLFIDQCVARLRRLKFD